LARQILLWGGGDRLAHHGAAVNAILV